MTDPTLHTRSPGDVLSLIPLERALLEGEVLELLDEEAIEVLSGCLGVVLCPAGQPSRLLFHLRAGRVLATPGFFGKQVSFPVRCELRPEGKTLCLIYPRRAMQAALLASRRLDEQAPSTLVPESLRRHHEAVGARAILDAASLVAWQQKALSASVELSLALFAQAGQDPQASGASLPFVDAQAELCSLQREQGAERSEHELAVAGARIAAMETELIEIRAALLAQERMTNLTVASALSAERQRQAERHAALLAEKDLRIADLELSEIDAEQRLSQQARMLRQTSEELSRARTDIVALQFSLETTRSELEVAQRLASLQRAPVRSRTIRPGSSRRPPKR